MFITSVSSNEWSLNFCSAEELKQRKFINNFLLFKRKKPSPPLLSSDVVEFRRGSKSISDEPRLGTSFEKASKGEVAAVQKLVL